MRSKIKILLLNNKIPHYRIPFFKMIDNDYDLTIVHEGPNLDENFKQIIIPQKKLYGIMIYPQIMNRIFNQFDIIISESNLRYIDRLLYIWNPFRKYKWINWGIGLRASYKNNIQSKSFHNILRYITFSKVDAHIFYSKYPINRYKSFYYSEKKLFVANNTVLVKNYYSDYKKEYFLFVGSLYNEKKIYELINNYIEYYKVSTKKYKLLIIGQGELTSDLKKFIVSKQMNRNIILKGFKTGEELSNYIFKSFAIFSPGQAGLSVSLAFGHGTPFITHKYAVTGGEIFNIKHNQNGILINDYDEISRIMLDIDSNTSKYINLGKNAKTTYEKNLKMESMFNSFKNCINYVYQNQKI